MRTVDDKSLLHLSRRLRRHAMHFHFSVMFERLISASSFFESDRNGVTYIFTNCFPEIGSYRQLVRAISQSHKRTLERMAIHCALYFDQSTGPKKLHRLRPDYIGPSGFVRTLLQFCCERSLHDSSILSRRRNMAITPGGLWNYDVYACR
jgi:hypothetical protein